MKPKVLVLTGYGINCDIETENAFNYVGADAERVHLKDLIIGQKSLQDYHILTVPGGFAYGDDIASGKVFANKLRYNIREHLIEFIESGKLILGVCNGFQILVKGNLLPALDHDYDTQQVTVTYNDSGRFEDRWVYLRVNQNSNCIFTRGIEKLYFPVRHGEGKFVPRDGDVLNRLRENNQIVVQYVGENGESNPGYPWNPNGSVGDVAGISDESGKIFGLMPHPEAYIHFTNHPRWTREKLPEEGMGVQIFRNAIEYVKKNL